MSSFDNNIIRKRNIALDIIKCIGVLLITNAHSWDLWSVIDRRIAVGGAQGVTLFFFVSGFAMMIGSTRRKTFGNFVRDKIKRLWPPVILWAIISSAIWGKIIDWTSFFALSFCYWFISCIFIYYILCYFIVNKSLKTKWFFLLGGVILTSAIILLLPMTEHSIYVDYHYYMYLGGMILGMIIGEYEQCGNMKVKGGVFIRIALFVGSLVCLFSYFVIIYLCKGDNNPYYYLQLFALIPLLLMALLMYLAFRGNDVSNYFASNRWLNVPVILISSLSLEIYIVQFIVITDMFNDYFPFSFIVNYSLVLVAAYILKVLSNLFISLFNEKYATKEKLFYI